MPYAGASDVTDRWGKAAADLDPEITTLITTRLADAERMINRLFKKQSTTLAAEIASSNVDQDDVVQIEAEAVLRLVRNPDGYQSETDGEYTYMLRSDLASGTLELLPGDREILGLKQAGMFIIEANPVMPV